MEFIITELAKEQLVKNYQEKKLRIKPKTRTWAGIIYEMVQDEPNDNDNIYKMEGFQFIINKEVEKDVSYLEIDYTNDWSGEEFVVTAGFWELQYWSSFYISICHTINSDDRYLGFPDF